jgi:hypothetical protein
MVGITVSHDNNARLLLLQLSVSQQAGRHDDEPWMNTLESHVPCSL